MTTLLALACMLHACSNDALVPPVIGDEVLAWTAVDYSRPVSYELTADEGASVCWRGEGHPWGACLDTGPQGRCRAREERAVNVSATDCAPRHNETACVRVRACDDEGDCSAWSADCVEFLGHPWVEFRMEGSP